MDPIRSCTYEYEYEYGIEPYNPIQSFPRMLGLEYEKDTFFKHIHRDFDFFLRFLLSIISANIFNLTHSLDQEYGRQTTNYIGD